MATRTPQIYESKLIGTEYENLDLFLESDNLLLRGCTDPSATNYNPTATVDDNSCEYSQIIPHVPDIIISDIIPMGCTDRHATNYDGNALIDDGSCIYFRNYDDNCTCSLSVGDYCYIVANDCNPCFFEATCTVGCGCECSEPILTNTCYCPLEAENDSYNILNNCESGYSPHCSGYGSSGACTAASGDINNDGIINIIDIIAIINGVLDINTLTQEQFNCADMNSDGIINVIDIISMINFILNNAQQALSLGNLNVETEIRYLNEIKRLLLGI